LVGKEACGSKLYFYHKIFYRNSVSKQCDESLTY
jgi:hypothetical protein